MINMQRAAYCIPFYPDFLEVAAALGMQLNYSSDTKTALIQEKQHGFNYTIAQFDEVEHLRCYMQGVIDVVRLANRTES